MAELRAELHECQSNIGLPAGHVRIVLMSSYQHLIQHDHPKISVLKVLTQLSMAALVYEYIQALTTILDNIEIHRNDLRRRTSLLSSVANYMRPLKALDCIMAVHCIGSQGVCAICHEGLHGDCAIGSP